MMAIAAWWPFKRSRKRDPYSRASAGDLDIVMPPPYEMSQAKQDAARRQVEQLIGSIKPGGLDAGSREVLNNLINAWGDQAVAEVDAERDERQAVSDILVGLAREEAARRKPRYDADLARVSQAGAALAVTFETLTGKKAAQVVPPRPPRADVGPIESTLGPIDISDDETFVDDDEFPPPTAVPDMAMPSPQGGPNQDSAGRAEDDDPTTPHTTTPHTRGKRT